MAIVKQCNRCGETFKKNLFTKKNEEGNEVFMDALSTSAEDFHLCDKCWEDLNKFMENYHGVVLLDPSKTYCSDCARRIAEPDTAITGKARFCPISNRIMEDVMPMCSWILLKNNPFKF